MLALRSQIFEYLRETFVGVSWVTCNRLVQKKKWEICFCFPTETPGHYRRFMKDCGRLGHVFAVSASPRSWTKKVAMSPSSTVHGGQYDTKCDIRVFIACGIRGGDNFRRST